MKCRSISRNGITRRNTVHQRKHDRTEGGLHLRVLVEPVEHDVRDRITLELDHDPHAVTVRLVAQVPDVNDLLVAHELRDLLDQPGLVHHERNLCDDDALPRVPLLDLGSSTHDETTAPSAVRVLDPVRAAQEPPGRKVGSEHEQLEPLLGHLWVFDQTDARSHHFTQVVRGNVGGHPDRDPGGAVHQQVWDLGGKDGRLVDPSVEVRDERNGFLVDVP